MRSASAAQPRHLFIFDFHSQRCTEPCGELSHVILPVRFCGKITALAPTCTEIVEEWLAGLCLREGQQIGDWRQALVTGTNELRWRQLGQRGAFGREFLDFVR